MRSLEKRIRQRSPLVWNRMKEGGWEIAGMTGNGHVQIRHLESSRKVAVSVSPSCHRSSYNTRARMRKIEAQHATLSSV